MFTSVIDERTHLRLLEEADAGELYAAIAGNRDYLARWMPWALHQTLDGTLEFIRASRRQMGENLGFQAAIVQDERIVGVLGFHRVDWQNLSTSVGYWIAEAAQGRGTMTRAAATLVDYAISIWKLNRIEIHAAVENTRSRAIPERLGFREEGVLRQAELVGGRFVDHVLYAMLGQEWPGARSRTLGSAAPE